MADRIEIAKLTEFVALGPPRDSIAVSKVSMFLILTPGDEILQTTQAHAYGFRVRRATIAFDDELGFSNDGALIWTGEG